MFQLESFRDTAKEFDVLTNIVPLLNSNVADVRLQAMRAVGNLCIDHGKTLRNSYSVARILTELYLAGEALITTLTLVA